MKVFFKLTAQGYFTQSGEEITKEMIVSNPHKIDGNWGEVEIPHEMFFFKNRVTATMMANVIRVQINLTGIQKPAQENIYRIIKKFLTTIKTIQP